jgi:hypothetical protein
MEDKEEERIEAVNRYIMAAVVKISSSFTAECAENVIS